MQIAPQTVVTLAYDITSEAGEIIESSEISGPITFIHGRSGLIPGLDKRLVGMEAGQEASFEFAPEEAFGTIDSAPRKTILHGEFPEGTRVEVGAEFEAAIPGGPSLRLHILELSPQGATVAVLHPLAGQRIGMSLHVLHVRAATARELETGKAVVRPPAPPPAG